MNNPRAVPRGRLMRMGLPGLQRPGWQLQGHRGLPPVPLCSSCPPTPVSVPVPLPLSPAFRQVWGCPLLLLLGPSGSMC